ncbi:MAG: hypothetical protein LBU11_04185, partial [Zoogloeaceae bacterium]|nr:hypothetical protein [Zoogloeaceae bacterium]
WSALVRYIIRQFLACKTRNPFFLALPNQVIGVNSRELRNLGLSPQTAKQTEKSSGLPQALRSQ